MLAVSKVKLAEGEVTVVEVQPSDLPPVRYDGRICIRVGPRRAFASEQEERRFSERRGQLVATFDVQPVLDAGLAQLSLRLFFEYPGSVLPSDVIEANHRTVEESLAALRFFDLRRGTATVAGVLRFGLNARYSLPGAYVQFLRFPGTSMRDRPVDQAEIDGDLRTVVEALQQRVKANNAVGIVAREGFRDDLRPAYPEWALRELLHNALIHRDYAATAPTRFYWFEDRIEIHNPGGLHREVTTDTLTRRSSYRNPVLAEAMKGLGFVNRYGYGLHRCEGMLQGNGKSPSCNRCGRVGLRRDCAPEDPLIPIAFFNNKGGVGKTALVSHLGWMYAGLGLSTLVVDLDPQANLSAMLLPDERLAALSQEKKTLLATVQPLMTRAGDVAPAHAEPIALALHLLAGDLGLSRFEDLLAENWSKRLAGEDGAFRVVSAFRRVMLDAARRVGAQLVLIDLGPNLGPLNRAALLAADHLVLPIAPNLFSLQGLENLGPTLRDWRKGWQKRRDECHGEAPDLPAGAMRPIGYVLMSFGVRDSRPVQADEDWIERIPRTYRTVVLDRPDDPVPRSGADPHRLAALKHHRSLMPLAMTAHKPMFLLKSADGARGAHLDAVRACYDGFFTLARRIATEVQLELPTQGN